MQVILLYSPPALLFLGAYLYVSPIRPPIHFPYPYIYIGFSLSVHLSVFLYLSNYLDVPSIDRSGITRQIAGYGRWTDTIGHIGGRGLVRGILLSGG